MYDNKRHLVQCPVKLEGKRLECNGCSPPPPLSYVPLPLVINRLVELTPLLVRVLSAQAGSSQDAAVTTPIVVPPDADEAVAAAAAAAEDDDDDNQVAGWQDAYYVLLLLERISVRAPAALFWPEGDDTEASGWAAMLWEQVIKLLLHRCNYGLSSS